MESSARSPRLQAEQVRILAHPLRMRLLAVLRLEGPATATQLARRLGTDTGKTSYHLRQLEAAGLVGEETERGNRRDRWWRALHRSTYWNPADHLDDPDTTAAADWLAGQAVRLHARWSDAFVQSRDAWSDEWIDASTLSDYLLELTPTRLRELCAELDGVIERFRADAAERDAPDAEHVTVVVHAFPNRHPVP